jgi:hypothetical protein
MDRTQNWKVFVKEQQRKADRDKVFKHMQSSATPLTNAEIDKLIKAQPDRWSDYKGKGVE